MRRRIHTTACVTILGGILALAGCGPLDSAASSSGTVQSTAADVTTFVADFTRQLNAALVF